MNIGREVVSKIRGWDGYKQPELNSDVELNNLIELIANELKSSYVQGNGPDWEAKLYKKGDYHLLPTDMEDIIKKLISYNPKIDATLVARILNQKRIYGLGMNVDRTISDTDVISFDVNLPELDYIKNNLVYGNPKLQKQFQKKIVKPYCKYLKDHKDESLTGIEVPQELVEKSRKIISPNLPKGMRDYVVSEYYLYNVLNLNRKEVQNQILSQYANNSNKGIRHLFEDKEETKKVVELLSINSEKNIEETDIELLKLKSLLAGISTQLYMNSRNLAGKTPQEIEDIIKRGYQLYTRVESNMDTTYNVDENGYRTVNVGLGNQDVLLHRDGDNIKRAMVNLTTSIEQLISKSKTLNEEEYMKEVAKLHYRYIAIHPFRDSNGRIGRNIINMLLAGRGKMFVLDRKDKDEYSKVMNEMREKIPLQEYLNALADNPELCDKYENSTCNKLTEFMLEHTHLYTENIQKKQEQESIERWKKANHKTVIYEDTAYHEDTDIIIE